MILAFNPEMMVLARESRGLTQSQLAHLMKVQQGTISKIESGASAVSEEFVNCLSTVLRYPPKFFAQNEHVYGFGSSVFYHRKRQRLAIGTLRQAHAQMNIRRNHVKALLRAAELDTKCHFRPLDLTDYDGRVEEIANVLRGAWRMPQGPVRNLTRAIEDAGGIVIRHDFRSEKIDAISEWSDLCPPLFFVNRSSSITGDRVRFSLAHEIGHVVMHRFPTPNMEDESNRFASEFLMPANEIRHSLRKLNLPKLAMLKREWKVSMAALIERAYQLGTVTDWQRRSLIMQLRGMTRSAREPSETDVPLEQPKLLAELVSAHIETLGYSASELSTMLMLDEKECEEMYIPQRPKVLGLRRA
jgi:Zn-dependent peptidase ImmA (M78 family)/transcriptional regulator with XRE-family HTH domain